MPKISICNLTIKNSLSKFQKIEKNFFFDLTEFFLLEIFHITFKLRMQSFIIIGQGVSEMQGQTPGQTQDGDLWTKLGKLGQFE